MSWPRLPRRFGRYVVLPTVFDGFRHSIRCMIVSEEKVCYIGPSARREDEAKGLEKSWQQPNRSETRSISTRWRTTFCSTGNSVTMRCFPSVSIRRSASATSSGSAGMTSTTRKQILSEHISLSRSTKPAKKRPLPSISKQSEHFACIFHIGAVLFFLRPGRATGQSRGCRRGELSTRRRRPSASRGRLDAIQ